MPREEMFSIRDFLSILFKHKYKMLPSFISIIIITAILVFSAPIHYVAKSVIMVKPGRELAPISDAFLPESRIPGISQESMINTEIQLIMSHDVISRVISAIGAYNIYPNLKSTRLSGTALSNVATAQFIQDLLVKAAKSGNTIEIYFRHKIPLLAAKVTNTLVEFSKDKHLEVFGTSKSPFIEEQLKSQENKLRELTDSLAAFKDKHQITSIKDQFFFIVAKRTDVENTLQVEESKLAGLINKVAFLKSQTTKMDQDLYTSNAMFLLTQLAQRETQMLGTYKENSRPVTSIRNEIKSVRDSLDRYLEEKKESKEGVSLEADIAPQKIRVKSLREQMDALDKQLAELSSSSDELNKLEREVSMQQIKYEMYLKKYEEVRIIEEMDKKKITNIQVLEYASTPAVPVKANLNKIIGVGLSAAFIVSLALAFAFEYIPQGITTPEGAKKHLHLPVLVAISYKK